MRHVPTLVALVALPACSVAPPPVCDCAREWPGTSFASFGNSNFNDYNDDGIPDDPHAAAFFDTDGDGVPDLSIRLGSLFADTDQDGVPDARVLALGGSAVGLAKAAIARASADLVRASNQQELEAALDAMQAAVDGARRTLNRER
jgi:hypothetical protein